MALTHRRNKNGLPDEVDGDGGQDGDSSTEPVRQEKTDEERAAELARLQARSQDTLATGGGVAEIVEELCGVTVRLAKQKSLDVPS